MYIITLTWPRVSPKSRVVKLDLTPPQTSKKNFFWDRRHCAVLAHRGGGGGGTLWPHLLYILLAHRRINI